MALSFKEGFDHGMIIVLSSAKYHRGNNREKGNEAASPTNLEVQGFSLVSPSISFGRTNKALFLLIGYSWLFLIKVFLNHFRADLSGEYRLDSIN